MAADAAVEFASYFQIGSAFNELRHVSWLTLTYVITVTVSQPMVPLPRDYIWKPRKSSLSRPYSTVDFRTYMAESHSYCLAMLHLVLESFCGNYAGQADMWIDPWLTSSSSLSFNFWLLVLARGVVGCGSGGMGYLVTVILNGKL
jgi:MFS family permease